MLFAGILTGFGFLIFSKLVESIKTVSQAFQSGNVFQEICSENAFFNFIFTNLKKPQKILWISCKIMCLK